MGVKRVITALYNRLDAYPLSHSNSQSLNKSLRRVSKPAQPPIILVWAANISDDHIMRFGTISWC